MENPKWIPSTNEKNGKHHKREDKSNFPFKIVIAATVKQFLQIVGTHLIFKHYINMEKKCKVKWDKKDFKLKLSPSEKG